MKILLIVKESPWSGSLAATAQRLARAMLVQGHQLAAVYFREEGAYHAVAGGAVDAAVNDLNREWQTLSLQYDFPLLLCASAAERRRAGDASDRFTPAGLPQVLELMAQCDRVVSF